MKCTCLAMDVILHILFPRENSCKTKFYCQIQGYIFNYVWEHKNDNKRWIVTFSSPNSITASRGKLFWFKKPHGDIYILEIIYYLLEEA